MKSHGEHDEGSLIILVLTLFSMLLITCSVLINVADDFLAKRQLIEIGEVAISQAAHQLSLDRYYSGQITMDTGAVDGAQFRVPIDCTKAQQVFNEQISLSHLRGNPIEISDWSCSNDEVTAHLAAMKQRLIYLPFNIGSEGVEISTSVGAISAIGGIRN